MLDHDYVHKMHSAPPRLRVQDMAMVLEMSSNTDKTLPDSDNINALDKAFIMYNSHIVGGAYIK